MKSSVRKKKRVYAALVAAGLIKNYRGEILLTERKGQKGKWTIPTGHMDPQDKDLSKALLREMKEEIPTLEIVIIEPLGTYVVNGGSAKEPKSIEVFSCNTSSSPEIIDYLIEGKERRNVVWIRPSQALKLSLDNLAFFAVKEYLKKYRRKKGGNGYEREKK